MHQCMLLIFCLIKYSLSTNSWDFGKIPMYRRNFIHYSMTSIFLSSTALFSIFLMFAEYLQPLVKKTDSITHPIYGNTFKSFPT